MRLYGNCLSLQAPVGQTFSACTRPGSADDTPDPCNAFRSTRPASSRATLRSGPTAASHSMRYIGKQACLPCGVCKVWPFVSHQRSLCHCEARAVACAQVLLTQTGLRSASAHVLSRKVGHSDPPSSVKFDVPAFETPSVHHLTRKMTAHLVWKAVTVSG